MSIKGDRLYYVVAALVFVVGGLDLTAYIMQRYEMFSQGLSDTFAVTGLGLWCLIAVLLVALPTVRKRKTGEESSEEPASQE